MKIFRNYPEIFFSMSYKKDGSMKEEDNFNKYLNKIRVSSIIKAGLCHGNTIFKARKKDNGNTIVNVDGLKTKEKNLFISITVADCIPVVFYNPKIREIGIIHAGWKGINLGIIENIKGDYKDILFYIGPGISKCHFEVSKDFPLPNKKIGNKYFSDLKEIIKEKIINCGGEKNNIEIDKDCTYCKKNKYFSFRRDKIINPMIVIVGIKERRNKS